MSLYLTIEVCAIAIPLIFSFDKNLQFYKNWKSVLSSFFITALIFLPVDIYFTKFGIWGFNSAYHSNILLFHLPLEEWLFFIAIPYASIFLHYVLVYYFPKIMLSNKITLIISVLAILMLLTIVFGNYSRKYTLFNSIIIILAITIAFFSKTKLLNRFYLSFLIILIPFFLVNSVLTGSFIEGEVLFYNPSDILGIRVFTIPVEDIGYAFSLILINLVLMNKFQTIFKSRSN
jgi:lycopene cyclase domain-containing protein